MPAGDPISSTIKDFMDKAGQKVVFVPGPGGVTTSIPAPEFRPQPGETVFVGTPMPKAEERTTFKTGAVRSADANATRYDLVTPIGLRAVANVSGPAALVYRKINSPIELVGIAIGEVNDFLWGDGCEGNLARAALAVMHAIQIEAGGFANVPVPPLPARSPCYEAIPPAGMRALAETYKEGSIKYGDRNWERGFPVHDLLNHGIKHLWDWLDGKRKEDDLGHAVWNFMAAIHSLELWPHLNEGHLRGPGCTPPGEVKK